MSSLFINVLRASLLLIFNLNAWADTAFDFGLELEFKGGYRTLYPYVEISKDALIEKKLKAPKSAPEFSVRMLSDPSLFDKLILKPDAPHALSLMEFTQDSGFLELRLKSPVATLSELSSIIKSIKDLWHFDREFDELTALKESGVLQSFHIHFSIPNTRLAKNYKPENDPFAKALNEWIGAELLISKTPEFAFFSHSKKADFLRYTADPSIRGVTRVLTPDESSPVAHYEIRRFPISYENIFEKLMSYDFSSNSLKQIAARLRAETITKLEVLDSGLLFKRTLDALEEVKGVLKNESPNIKKETLYEHLFNFLGPLIHIRPIKLALYEFEEKLNIEEYIIFRENLPHLLIGHETKSVVTSSKIPENRMIELVQILKENAPLASDALFLIAKDNREVNLSTLPQDSTLIYLTIDKIRQYQERFKNLTHPDATAQDKSLNLALDRLTETYLSLQICP